MELTPQTKIVIIGHGDVLETSLRMHFAGKGLEHVAPAGSFDPLNGPGTLAYLDRERPDIVILASVRSGGIGINQARPAEMIHANLLAQMNVIDAAYRAGVKKFLFLAASCIYPVDCPQPMKAEHFLGGPMELTSLAYSMAKAAGVVMCQAYRRQYGFNAIVGVPATVYGPGAGAMTPEETAQAHVLGALVEKFERAVREGQDTVEVWGSGAPRREFIFGDDFARACVLLLERYDQPGIINMGAGEDMTVRDLALNVAAAAGFKGEITWDRTKPDGAMQKLLDSTPLWTMGWTPRVSLKEGIALTCEAWRRLS